MRSDAEKVRLSFEKHPDWDLNRRAKALALTHGDILRHAGGHAVVVDTRKVTPAPALPAPKKVRPKGLEEFKRTYSKAVIVPGKVRAALEKLGPDGWLPEQDFARIAGISSFDLGLIRSEFEDNWFQHPRDSKRFWAGSKELKQAMEESI